MRILRNTANELITEDKPLLVAFLIGVFALAFAAAGSAAPTGGAWGFALAALVIVIATLAPFDFVI